MSAVPSTGGVIERCTDEIEELAVGMARLRAEDRSRPDREHGTRRTKDHWQSGYIAGLAAAASKLTGEPAMEIEARIVVQAGDQ